MAGIYSQIYIQVVFAVKGRQNLLHKDWRDEVFKYMSGIIKIKAKSPLLSTAFLTTFTLSLGSDRQLHCPTLFGM